MKNFIKKFVLRFSNDGCRYVTKNGVGEYLCPLRGRCLYKTPSAARCRYELGMGPLNYTDQCIDRKNTLQRYRNFVKILSDKGRLSEKKFADLYPEMWKLMNTPIIRSNRIQITEDLVHSIPYSDFFELLFTNAYNQEYIDMMKYLEGFK